VSYGKMVMPLKSGTRNIRVSYLKPAR